MKKFAKFVFEIFLALRLAHKWHRKFRSVLQFVRADALIQKEISDKLGSNPSEEDR